MPYYKPYNHSQVLNSVVKRTMCTCHLRKLILSTSPWLEQPDLGIPRIQNENQGLFVFLISSTFASSSNKTRI